MESLSKIRPSTSAVNESAAFTPKRTIISRLGTPIQFPRKQEVKESTAIRNPFDVKTESLYLHSCSPSIFATFQRSKKDDGTMPWSIEHLSVLYPADIDETSLPDPWLDEDQEQQAQKAIDTFFSQNSIVPSPWSSSPKDGKLKSRRRAVMSSAFEEVQSCEASTQTMLSIPPEFDLKKILGNFFSCDDDDSNNSKDDSDFLSTSSLRRKLFANDEDFSSPFKSDKKVFFSSKRKSSTVYMRSAQSTPASVLSSSPISPPNCSDSCNIITSPPISPISAKLFQDNNESLPDCFQENMYKTPLKRSSLNETSEDMSFCMANSQESEISEHQDTGYATVSITDTNSVPLMGSSIEQRFESEPTFGHQSEVFSKFALQREPAPTRNTMISSVSSIEPIVDGSRHLSNVNEFPVEEFSGFAFSSKPVPTRSTMISSVSSIEANVEESAVASRHFGSVDEFPGEEFSGFGFTTKPVPTRSSHINSISAIEPNVDESIASRHFGYVSRITPVEEFMDECELSSDMSYQNAKGTNELSSLDCSKPEQCNVKGYSWVPTCCSTPARCSHS